MKLLATILAIVAALAMPVVALAYGVSPETKEDDKMEGMVQKFVADELKKMIRPCPKTTMVQDCLRCHLIPSFAIKETRREALYDTPNANIKILDIDAKKIGYLKITAIDSDQVFDALNYFNSHPEITRIVFELYSPGGSMMGAWRTVAIMDEWKARGVTIETRVFGYAASAGFLIFANGTKGHRIASPTALLMWHEVLQIKRWDIATPSSKEDEARILRLFQNNGNDFLSSKSNLTKEEIDKLIRHQEFWMTGAKAFEYGFADKLLK